MPRITFLEADTEDHALIREHCPDATIVEGILADRELVASCKDAQIISTFIQTHFTREVILQLPALKLLCTRSVGYDHIDIDSCRERGITVCNVPDYGSHVIAEHVFALLLSTLRHIPEGAKRVQSGTFDYHGLRGMALRGKTIGIIGTGKIGRRVAQIAHGFGMNIIAADQCRTLELTDLLGLTYVAMDELLKKSDIITLHVPATPDTKHLFQDATFARMKKGVILINTARGDLIDSHALLRSLNDGTVGYALLDVLEHEQVFAENKELIAHPRVVTTPHIAFYADESMRNMYLDTFQSIEQWTGGKTPEHAIKPLSIVCDLPSIRH